MAEVKNKFGRGDKLRVKGRSGTHVVSWPMLVPVATIEGGQFLMVTTPIYKFNADTKDVFYAYEKDCTNDANAKTKARAR